MSFTAPTKSCQLAGQHIKIISNVAADAILDAHEAVGLWASNDNQILLHTKMDADHKGQTYCHEIVHGILYIMGKEELSKDEPFVDLFGHLLYQVLKTAK